VRQALRGYEAAYEALDARAVRSVYPALGDQRQRDLQRAFDAYRTLSFELRDCTITVSGETAQAQCRMRQEFQPKVGEGARREAGITFRLRRQGEGWRIESVGG
jgi:ketosteroid isomerase-like protein